MRSMKHQLKSISEQTPYESFESVDNCGVINSNIYEALVTELDKGHVKLINGYVSDGANKSTHIFVVYSLDEKYIIDGALDQFCNSNYKFDRVCLGDVNSIPSLHISKMKNSDYNYTRLETVYEKQL